MAARASRAKSRSRAAGESSRAIQRATTGSAAAQMSWLGSMRRATPSTVTMVFCSSTSSGRRRMSKRAVISNSWPSSRPIETSRALQAEHRLADRAQRLGERGLVVVGGHVAGLEVHPGDPHIVAPQEAPEDLGQVAPLAGSQPADDAEVHRRQPRRRGDEQVPLVQVGVEDAVVQRLGQEGADQVVGQRRPVEPRRRPARPDRRAARRAPTPGSAPACATPSQTTGGARMKPSWAITARSSSAPAASKRRSSSSSSARTTVSAKARGSSRRAAGAQALGQTRRRRAAPRRRAATRALDARPQHLHRHLRPPTSRGAMRLRQRGGGDRLRRTRRTGLERPARAPRRPRPWPPPWGTAAAGPSAATGRRRRRRRRCRRGSRGTGRA